MNRFSRLDADVLVVGAGFAGSILAERLAAPAGQRVLLIDQRDHIAGNAYDYLDEHGVLVHKYGPHIFHTNAEKVVDYLSRFTDWRPYEHRVRALGRRAAGADPDQPHDGQRALRAGPADRRARSQAFYAERAEPIDFVRTSEDAVVSKVGRDLYEKFFRGYTLKQWNRDPSRAARVGGVAHPDAHQHGRPLLHRQLPEDAGRGLHGDVRAYGRPPADRACGCRRTSSPSATSCAAGTSSSPGRSTATSTAATASCRTARWSSRCARSRRPDGGLVQPVGTINEPGRRGALHAHDGVPAPHGPAAASTRR